MVEQQLLQRTKAYANPRKQVSYTPFWKLSVGRVALRSASRKIGLVISLERPYALRILRVVEALPMTATTRVIGDQLLRSGTSVGANYRSAQRARSPADFVAKMSIVEEEADETIYWYLLNISGSIATRVLEKISAIPLRPRFFEKIHLLDGNAD